MIQRLPFELPPAGLEIDGDLPHVLLVVDQFPKMLGGGERMVLKLGRLLPNYGFRASILTFFAHPECTGLQPTPCPIYLLPLNRTYDLAAFRAALALKRFLKNERIRLVQTFFESSDLWAGIAVKAMSDAKLIWSRRDMGILRTRKHQIAYRWMAGLPDAVFAVSEQVRRHCIEVDGIDPARVETVYNGLDLDQWKPVAQPSASAGEMLIVTVGNIRRVKGQDLMIRAAAAIAPRFPAARFCIAGAVLEPDYFQELESLVAELGLTERFLFAGPVTDTQAFLAGAGVFVLPSRSEGFSNAIIEAMAAGLPVVATDVGGNAEAVHDGISGFIVPAEDIDALADSIAALLSDPARARIMGEAGEKISSQKFTTDATMSRVTGAYRRLLALG